MENQEKDTLHTRFDELQVWANNIRKSLNRSLDALRPDKNDEGKASTKPISRTIQDKVWDLKETLTAIDSASNELESLVGRHSETVAEAKRVA